MERHVERKAEPISWFVILLILLFGASVFVGLGFLLGVDASIVGI